MSEQRSERRATKAGEPDEPRVEQDGAVWRVRSLEVARQVLRARSTAQAGFTAEAIPRGRLRHHPILISDGPLHDEQRRKVGHFFAPTVVAERYTGFMRSRAVALVGRAQRRGRLRVDTVALRYAVEVTRRAVGLEHSSVAGMSRRLVRVFNQPPFDITQPAMGRSRLQQARAAVAALAPIGMFYLADVRPAVRALRRAPRQNVVSHLIAEGYGATDILVECITYGTAGMVTTREFVAMACWHLLDDPALTTRFLGAGPAEREAILHEILRLEPVVGHLYRRVQESLTVRERGRSWTLLPGDLVDVCVRQADVDPDAAGADPLLLRPGRSMPAGVDPAGLGFSDGPHSCPGQSLAMTETAILLEEILRRDPALVRPPRLGWDNLVSGYTLRGMELTFPSPARS